MDRSPELLTDCSQSLAKRAPGRYLWLLGAVFFSLGADAAPRPTVEQQDLRDCIAGAAGAAALQQCENQAQKALLDKIERWSAGIKARLRGSDRKLFEANEAAWKAWFAKERQLLKSTLKRRGDGMGGRLLAGAVTRLYEDRERQLRDHLHNLSYAAKKR